MATTDLEKLQVSLSADIKQYERAMAKASQVTVSQLRKMERDTQASLSRVEKSWKGAGSVISGFGKGLVIGGITAAVAGIEELVRGAITSAAAIGDLSDKIGINTDLLQGLQHGAVQANMSFEDLSTGLLKFSKNIGEAANGQGELYNILKANNVAVTDASGKQRPLNDLLNDFADLVQNASSEQQALLLVVAAMGKGGEKFLEFLRDGSSGLKVFQSDLTETGRRIDGEMIKKAQQLDDDWAAAMDSMKTTTQSFILDAITGFGTMLTAAKSSFTDIQDAYEFTKKVLSGQPTNGTRVEPDGFGGFNIVDNRTSNDPLTPAGTTSDPGKGSIKNSLGNKPKVTVVDTKKQSEAVADLTKKVVELTPEEQHLNDLYEEQLKLEGQLYDSKMQLAQTAFDAFEAIAVGGEKATDVLKDLAAQMLKAVIAASLFGSGPLGSILGTKSGGGLFGNLFGGARAGGGPVSAGKAYLVGENRPEMFVPNQSGNIIPKLGRGGGTNVQIIDQRTNAPAIQQQRGGDGTMRFFVRDQVNSVISSGQADSALKSRHGLTPVKARRS